jgi:predicted ATPase/class 3 adenylate cyclase
MPACDNQTESHPAERLERIMPDLPSGTVTFLFTDIEGSTRLWERDAVAMRAAVARHDVLLTDAVASNRGVVYKHVGDAVQAAFPKAADALAAVAAAQRALAADSWPETGPLRVRMALHAGQAMPDARGDYHQVPALNRLARLLAAGHGGQVLVSETVQRLIDGTLPPGVALKDLGRHRLRDLLEPERIGQLVIAGLPEQFPPLRSLEGHATNLPIQPTPLIGREADLDAVGTLLRQDDVRLVTLTGVGGTGKTRLALQIGAELLEAFDDGVFFVDLAPLADPALVLGQIAATLGVRESGDRSLRDALLAYLAGKRLVLLLDNFEHLLAAAPVVADILAASTGPKILVTSRAPLHLRGEQEYAVPPLSLPDTGQLLPIDQLAQVEAIALFVQRARSAQRDFTLDQDNANAVAEICTRLDGLPLAIELAAARIKLLSPPALLARLERRLPVLTGGARDLPARQRTLRDTIAWSVDLLSPDEQTLLRRLAVFAGGATLEAVEAVANPNGEIDVLVGVSGLVDHSLLRQAGGSAGEPRFWMLETIREFGLERLAASGEDPELRRRHAYYFLALTEALEPRLCSAEQAATLAQLTTEHPNLRTTLGWASDGNDAASTDVGLRLSAALYLFWDYAGYLEEGLIWLAAFLRQSAVPADPHTLARALIGAGHEASLLGDFAGGRAYLQQAEAIGRETGAGDVVAAALYEQACTALFAGDLLAAGEKAAASLTICRRTGNDLFAAQSLWMLGLLATEEEDFARAASLLAESLSLCQELGDPTLISFVLKDIANLDYWQGNYEAARARAEEARAVAKANALQSVISMLEGFLAEVAVAQGDYDRAAGLAATSVADLRRQGLLPQAAWSLRNLAAATLGKQDLDRAGALFAESLTLFRDQGVVVGMASSMVGLASVAAARGDAIRATRLLGAVEAKLAVANAQFAPADREAYRRVLAIIATVLSEETCEANYTEGRALGTDEMIAQALAITGLSAPIGPDTNTQHAPTARDAERSLEHVMAS